ncbi:MAG TPA: hypothetical protein VFT70_18175 [Nocardioides sp.]|nr:hypothetical protein [Nocardioides sp.]
MRRPRGISGDVDAETAARIAHSLLAVRMVRGSLLLLFLVVVLAGVMTKHWPTGVAVGAAVAVALQAARVVVTVRRYRHTAPGRAQRTER